MMYSDTTDPVASSSTQDLMLSPVDQETRYYYLDQEAMHTSESLWHSDWQADSYNMVQDPEKTPTMRPTELSQQAFHFQDSLAFQQSQNLSYLNYDSTSALNATFDADPALFLDIDQPFNAQLQFTQDTPITMNPYTDANLFFEPNATHPLTDAPTNDEDQIQHTHDRYSNSFPRALSAAFPGPTHPFPTYDEIFKSAFVKRVFHLDRFPKDWIPPLRETKPFVTTVTKAEMTDRQAALDFLSKEICVRICDYLEPHEITKFGMTRKSLHKHVVEDRNIWYRALRRFTSVHSVPLSFYPTKMSMSAFSMRIMADWPTRWLHALKTRPQGGHPYERRAFNCRGLPSNQTLPAEPSYRGLSLLLMPSGRYLIADDGKEMFFWDVFMGSHLPFEFGCSYIHEHPTGARPSKPTLEAYQSPRGDIRVIAFFERTKDKIGRYIIYDVHPRDYLSPSTIMPVYRGSEHEKGGLYACKGDLFATLVGKVLSVRNIVSQCVERLTIYNDPPAKLMMFSGPCSVVLVHMHGFAVYNVSPELLDSLHKRSISARTVQPTFSMAVDFNDRMNKDIKGQGSYTPPVFDKSPLWYQNSDTHPLVFDIVRNRKGKEIHQVRWRYEIHFPNFETGHNIGNAQGSSSLASTCRCINRILVPNQWTQLRNFGFCKNQIILAGSSPGIGAGIIYAPDHLPVHDGKIGTNRGCVSSYLFRTEVPEMPHTNDMQLCPVTGRVCYTTHTPYEIGVIDYFYV